MPNKMTDNEIIKALECCVSEQYTCSQCPYQEIKHYDDDNGVEIMPNGKQYDDWSCERWLNVDLLDLINRQKAELEKNENIIRLADKTIATQQAEIERLQAHIKEGIDLAKQTQEMLKLVQAEAVKEFAERLNKEAESVGIDRDGFLYSDSDNTAFEIYDTVAEWCKEITNNLLKEMESEK